MNTGGVKSRDLLSYNVLNIDLSSVASSLSTFKSANPSALIEQIDVVPVGSLDLNLNSQLLTYTITSADVATLKTDYDAWRTANPNFAVRRINSFYVGGVGYSFLIEYTTTTNSYTTAYFNLIIWYYYNVMLNVNK